MRTARLTIPKETAKIKCKPIEMLQAAPFVLRLPNLFAEIVNNTQVMHALAATITLLPSAHSATVLTAACWSRMLGALRWLLLSITRCHHLCVANLCKLLPTRDGGLMYLLIYAGVFAPLGNYSLQHQKLLHFEAILGGSPRSWSPLHVP